MWPLTTGLKLEESSRAHFGGLGLEDAVLEHTPARSVARY